MNESGGFVKKLISAYHLVPSDLFIIHDCRVFIAGQEASWSPAGTVQHFAVSELVAAWAHMILNRYWYALL